MPEDIGLKWDKKYRSKKDLSGKPANVLTTNLHILPANGIALDLACGTGANAIMLAEYGLKTVAWDVSKVALTYLNNISKSAKLNITTEYRDVTISPPEPGSFDVIVVAHFLDRSIVRHLISALKLNGLLFYQTFTKARTKKPSPDNPVYKLDENELLRLFNNLTIRYYREEGQSDTDDKYQGLAMLVGQKSYNNN
jgi:SAM-dependent methyltransferase